MQADLDAVLPAVQALPDGACPRKVRRFVGIVVVCDLQVL